MDLSLLTALNKERAARRAAILITAMADGTQRLVRETDAFEKDSLAGELSARFRSGKSGLAETDDGKTYFLTVNVPAPRFIIIGAVHISQALVPMANLAGFDVLVIDPRQAFATEERFPSGNVKAEWPQDVLKDHPLDRYTALAALTHDPKIDDLPLIEAMKAGCFYIGALGSRKTHAKRVERMKAEGLADNLISGIDAPIGADIGAASPTEIAVSVLANVISALRKEPVPAQ